MVERRNFTDKEIQSIWEKATKVANNNPDVFRQDYAGAWIRRSDYGNRDSQYGWEIDHIKPLAKGGTYDDTNLLPAHWKNNKEKGDNYPNWSTAITSEGAHNINGIKNWTYNE